VLSGLASGSEVELHAAATIESWKKIGEAVFDSKTSSKTVELNAFYGLKIELLTFLIF
jgi:hypothetical protein